MAFNPERIRQRRKELGWTQERLTHEWFNVHKGGSITKQTISYWENGSKNPTLENLTKLAKIIGVHEGYFFN